MALPLPAKLTADISTRFSRAILRTPADSCVDGISEAGLGPPDPALFRQQHANYSERLTRAGVTVTTLSADENFPDSVFVEDPALCLPHGAILLRSAAAQRRGEAATLEPALHEFYGDHLSRLPDGAFADGGDILVTGREIMVGLSARTNPAGAAAIAALAGGWGYSVRTVATPAGILHLKTDCSTLGGECILSTRRLAASGVFDGYDIILAPDAEAAAANAIRVNDTVFVAAGFEKTAAVLSRLGLRVESVDVSEAAKLDGGLSCMSLRFDPQV